MLRKCFLSKVTLLAVLLVSAISLNGQSVSPSGAFTYEYPIEIPKGTNGMQPSISLAYNSQAGNGIAGMGWSLTGFPAITRDTSYPINWNNDDHFVFGGHRLIRDSQNSLLYHTEAESFQKIEYVNNDHWVVSLKNGTKMYFGATTDSKIEAIGKNAPLLWSLNKVIDVNGNYYTVTYEEDTANGDYYPKSVKYTQNDNGLISAYKEVLFDYDLTRKDKYKTYNPSQMEMNQRLKTVTVNIDNALFKKYEIEYKNQANSGDRSKISYIQEYGSDGSPLPNEIKFNWQRSENSFLGIQYGLGDGNHVMDRVFPGDFNGDGLSDLAIVFYDSVKGLQIRTKFSNSDGTYDGANYSLGDGNHIVANNWNYAGDYNGDGLTDLAFMFYDSVKGMQIRTKFSNGDGTYRHVQYSLGDGNHIMERIFPGDFNGDGLSDISMVYYDSVKGLQVRTKFSNGDGTYWGALYGLGDGNHIVANNWNYVGDYNGDGLTDLAFMFHDSVKGMQIRTKFSNGDGTYKHVQYSLGDGNHIMERIFPGDFNGDGFSDISMVYYDSVKGLQIRTKYSNGDGTYWGALYSLGDGNHIVANNWNYAGDYNGDGLTDLAFMFHDSVKGMQIRTKLSNGDGSYGGLQYSLSDGSHVLVNNWNYPGDYDGDGLTDLAFLFYDSVKGMQIRTKMCRMRNEKELSSIILSSGVEITPTYAPAPQVSGAVNPDDSDFPNITNKSPRNVVTSLTISEGNDANKTNISTYEYFNGKYRSGVRDERKQLGFEWTIKRNPDGSYVKTYFHQEDDHNGGTSGLLAGFAKRAENYGKDGLLYFVKEIEYFSRPVQAEFSNYKAVKFKYKSKELEYHFNGVAYTTWAQLKTLSDLEVLKTEKSYTYDVEGNLIQVFNKGDLSTKADDIIIDTLYTSGDLVLPYSVKQYEYPLGTTIYGTLASNENLAKHNELFYDESLSLGSVGTKGHVTKKIEYSGEIDQLKYPNLVSKLSYDEFGNITSVTNEDGGITTINYEGRFYANIKSKTNALNQLEEEFGYDNLERVLWKKDINDQYLWYKYDIKNREIEVAKGDSLGPGRVLSRTYYSDIVSPNDYPRWIKKETYRPSTQSSENYIESFTYVDNFDNQLQTKVQGFNESGYPTWITTSFYEDPISGIKKTSEPYTESDSLYSSVVWDALRHTAEYTDSIGRLYKTVYANGFKEYAKYGINGTYSLSVDSTGLAKVSFEEVVDNKLIKYSYPKGTYTYADLGTSVFNVDYWIYKVETDKRWDGISINEISKADYQSNKLGNKLVTKTDALGRKKYYTDPNMGTWFYEYDKNGNIKSQTDANGYTTYFEYDKLNRVVKKIGANTTIYLYDGKSLTGEADHVKYGQDCLGQLTELYYEDGSFSEYYYYDNTNKEYKITKTIDGITRTVTTTLDDLGRKISEALPDNEVVSYHYKNDGNLKSIKSSTGKTYVNNFQYTIVGKVDSYESANSSTTKYTYNNNHQLVDLDIKDHIGASIAVMKFVYDGFGNITYKTFESGNLNFDETYTYDGFSRLEKAVSTQNLYGIKDYIYDDYNNIISKNGLTYKYNQIDGKPHAVSEIEDGLGNVVKTYKYDENGNVVKITGQSHLVVSAKAVSLSNPPIMELRLDGELKKTWIVTSTSYQDYSWDGVVPQGATIDIVLNEKNSSNPNIMIPMSDLYVDYININGSIVHSESTEAVLDSGSTVSECFDNLNVTPGQELMSSLSALRYEIPAVAKNPVRDMYYNADNKLISIWDNSVMTSSFKYDDAGQRIKKTEGNITTYYFFDSYEEEYLTENGIENLQKSIKHFFANNQRVAYRETMPTNESNVYYYHTDHLGSAVRITDETGKIIQSIAYTPFGEVAWFSGEDSTSYTYTGQESDGSGFMYYNARYYDPELGRFIQSDTHLDGVNRYTYCGNNPVMYSDPTGNVAQGVLVGIGIGIVVGGITGGIIADQKGYDLYDIEFWAYVGVGAVIGGLAGAAGGAIIHGGFAANGLLGAAAGYVDAALAGATGGFITNFGNTIAFGGEGTALFKGDFGEAMKNGAFGALYGAVLGATMYGCSDLISNEILKFGNQKWAQFIQEFPRATKALSFIDDAMMYAYSNSGTVLGGNVVQVANLITLIDDSALKINIPYSKEISEVSGIDLALEIDGSAVAQILKPALWYKDIKDKDDKDNASAA